MAEVKCKYCGKVVIKRGNYPMICFTNIALKDSPYYFCNKDCKMVWLAERQRSLEESIEEKKEKAFPCKYNCGKTFDNKQGASVHSSWCDKNPNSRAKLTFEAKESYTIEELRKIDKIIGLTDKQIAEFVRGKRKGES